MRLGDPDRVPEAERLVLAHRMDLREVCEPADQLQLVVLAARWLRLELGRAIEVVLDRALAPGRDDQDVGEAGPHGFLDDELDRGLSISGSISLGTALVAGRNRVPSPAAGITAFLTFTCALLVREPKCTRSNPASQSSVVGSPFGP